MTYSALRIPFGSTNGAFYQAVAPLQFLAQMPKTSEARANLRFVPCDLVAQCKTSNLSLW